MASTTTTPIELKLADGSVIKAEDVNEALKTAVKMKEDTAAALRSMKEQFEASQAQVAALSSQVQQYTAPKPEPGSFDKDRYYKLLNDDPVRAQNYVDSYRFGLPEEQVPQRFTELNRNVEEIRANMLAGAFLQQHPEFPPDQAATMRQQVEQLTNQGFPFTVDTMNLAYTQLVQVGKIKPLEIEEEQKAEEPPPSPRGAGASLDADVSKAENLSDRDLEAFLRSKGMLGR